MPAIITLTPENIATEHICCAITEKKGENCVATKKAWLCNRLPEGLQFKKLDIRGKVFIEYLPATKAWLPIEATGYMHINCFWVSGQYKGKGFSNLLLAECIQEAKAKGFFGVTALSSARKKPFLSDGSYLKHKDFLIADTAEPYYELLYLPFAIDAPVPRFKSIAKDARINESGIVLYYTHQCPFTEKYASLFQSAAAQKNVPMTLHKLTSTEQAQNAPAPFTTYSLFYNGSFVTNEILSEKKIEKFLNKIKK